MRKFSEQPAADRFAVRPINERNHLPDVRRIASVCWNDCMLVIFSTTILGSCVHLFALKWRVA